MLYKSKIQGWDKISFFIVISMLCAIGIFYFYSAGQNTIVGFIADDAKYLLMTDFFSPYYSLLSKSAAFIMQSTQFPPLYPFLLAILGASSENLLLAHILTTSFFLGALVIFVIWIYEDGVNKLTGACLSLIIICSPASLFMNLDLWSEHLFLLFTMCALYLIEKARKNYKYWLVALLFISSLPLIRVTGVAFLLAFFVYLYINKIPHRFIYMAISAIPIIVWKIFTTSNSPRGVYENILSNFYEGDIRPIVEELFLGQLPNLWIGWHQCFDIQRNLESGLVAACVLALASVTWALRLKNKRLDSLYVMFYLILMWLWPSIDSDLRYIFVVMPILVYYSCLSLFLILETYTKESFKKLVCYASIIFVLITFLPTDLYALNKFFTQVSPELKRYRSTKYWLTQPSSFEMDNSVLILNKVTQSYKEAKQYIPEGECAYSVHYEEFMFHSRRLAFPLPLPGRVEKDNFVKEIGRCEYIHINNTNSHPYVPVAYPIELLGGNFDYLMLTRMTDAAESPIVGALVKMH